MDDFAAEEIQEKFIDSSKWREAFKSFDLKMDKFVIATLSLHFPISNTDMLEAIRHALDDARQENLEKPDLARLVAGIRKTEQAKE